MSKTLTLAEVINDSVISFANSRKNQNQFTSFVSDTPPVDLFENMRKMAMLPYVASLPFDYFAAEKIWQQEQFECFGDKYISVCDNLGEIAGDAYVLHQAKKYKIDHSDDMSISELVSIIESWEYDLSCAYAEGVNWDEDNYDPSALQMYTEEAKDLNESELEDFNDFIEASNKRAAKILNKKTW